MTKIFDGKLSQLSVKYDGWDRILQDFLYSHFGQEELSEEQDLEISLQFQEVLSAIMDLFLLFGKFRDSWELPPKIDIYPFGQGTIVKSGKMDHDFSFGFYESEFFIESYILYPWNLKHMPDEFWNTFTELSTLGAFSFQENIFPVFDEYKPIPAIFKGGRSNVYKIIRNYMALEQYSDGSLDLGWFKIQWHQETKWDVLINRGCEAFKKIYRLNYMLYRDEYIRRKAKRISFK